MITSGIFLLCIVVILFYGDRYYKVYRLKKIGKLIAKESNLTTDNINNLIYNNTNKYSKIKFYQYNISNNTLLQLNNNSEKLNTQALDFLNHPLFINYIKSTNPKTKCFYSKDSVYLFIPNLKPNNKPFMVLSLPIDNIESIFKK